MANYTVRSPVLLESFDTLGDFTATGTAGGTLAAETTIKKVGTGSLKITTASGGNYSATKTISFDGSAAGTIGIWVYIPNQTLVTSVVVYLSHDSGFTNYYLKTFSNLHRGWNFLSTSRVDWSFVGSPAWTTPFTTLRVRVNAAASSIATAYFDAMYHNLYTRPKVLLTFDDGLSSAYTEGYTYMQTKGLKSTFYLVRDFIDTSGYMTTAQCRTLYSSGHDIGDHTVDHTVLSTLSTQAEVEAKWTPNQAWIASNGWTRAMDHGCYPTGAYSTEVLAAMSNLGYITARCTVANWVNPATGLDEVYLLNGISIGNTTTLATAKGYIDAAIGAGQTIFLVFHSLVASPANGNQWGISDFQALIDYIVTKRNQIDVVTISEWYNGLTSPRRIV